MSERGQAYDSDLTDAWHGPAIVGLTYSFADPDVERRFLSAMAPANRDRLLFLTGIGAVLIAISIAAAWLRMSGSEETALLLLPRALLLAACLAGFAVALFTRRPRALEMLAFALGALLSVFGCVLVLRLPADTAPAFMVGGLTLLYFALPLRLAVLAPMMAAMSGAAVSAWFTRAPSEASVVAVLEWIWVINLLGLVCVRTMRLMLRREWSQSHALRHMATHDGLTGIANRQFYDHALTREWARCLHAGTALSVILIDVDHFKLLNDCIGHPAGDSCLRSLAMVLENTATRPIDLVARTGGEEFAILLPDTNEAAARTAASRVIGAIAAAAIAHPASPISPFVTVSLGVATAHPHEGFAPWELTALADRLVYRAKQDGRNRMRQQTLGEPLLPRRLEALRAAE